MLNNPWGKLAQREALQQKGYFTEFSDLYAVMTDPTLELISVVKMTQSMMHVTYKAILEYKDDARVSTNPILASFVTAIARLKLYEELEKLQERVLYMVNSFLLDI